MTLTAQKQDATIYIRNGVYIPSNQYVGDSGRRDRADGGRYSAEALEVHWLPGVLQVHLIRRRLFGHAAL